MTAIHELVVPRSIPRILDIFEKIVLLFPYPLSRRRLEYMILHIPLNPATFIKPIEFQPSWRLSHNGAIR